jgi:hypothetical protein
MFKKSNRGKGKRSVQTVRLLADNKTEAAIPNPGGLQVTGIPTTSMKLKFVCGTATTSTVTWANLLDTVVFAVTSTSVYDLFFSARLKAVEIWLPPSVEAVSANAQCSLAFDSPSQGDQRLWVVNSGPQGGYVRAKPSNHSINGWTWQDSSAVGAFTLNNCPVGALIQLDMTFRVRMGQGSAVAAAQAATGASVGTVYFRGMDGLATASTKFPPVPAAYSI